MPPSRDADRPDVTVDRRGGARRAPDPGFLLRALRVLALAAAVALGVMLVYSATEVFLLGFAGVLIAVLLRAPSDWLSRRTGLWPRLSLALVALAIVAALAGLGWLAVPRLIEEAGQLADRLPRAIGSIEDWVRGLGGERLDLRLRTLMPSLQALAGRIPGIVTMTFGALASVLVVVAVAVFLAAYPDMYSEGFVRLFPINRRVQARATLAEIGRVLKRFLAGQLVAMAVVGALTYVGLLVLGIPLALTLAVIAALLAFIPYIGPMLAAVPMVLVGMSEGPTTALYALGVYLAVQALESNAISPLVQERAVYLPPALTILFQALMGVLFGIIGVFIATPLAAVMLVVVQRLYIEGILEGGDGRAESAG